MELPASVRMFLQPRATMRWILQADPNYGVMSIALLAGITAFLRSSLVHGFHPLPGLVGIHPNLDAVIAYGVGATPAYGLHAATIIIAGALFGVVGVYLGGWFLFMLGRMIGGIGPYRDVRSALSWAFVPYSWLLPLWIVAAVLFGPELRMESFAYDAILPPPDRLFLTMLVFADYWLRAFCLVWLVAKLSVAHRFAIWRSLLTVLVAAIALVYLAPRYAPLGF